MRSGVAVGSVGQQAADGHVRPAPPAACSLHYTAACPLTSSQCLPVVRFPARPEAQPATHHCLAKRGGDPSGGGASCAGQFLRGGGQVLPAAARHWGLGPGRWAGRWQKEGENMEGASRRQRRAAKGRLEPDLQNNQHFSAIEEGEGLPGSAGSSWHPACLRQGPISPSPGAVAAWQPFDCAPARNRDYL